MPGRGLAGARSLALAVPLLLSACAMRITPPAVLRDPVTVYIADYGEHGSLLLPGEDGGVVEFAFGQWDWFALNRHEWYRAVLILLAPSPGALGTRPLPDPRADVGLATRIGAEALIPLSVEREDADALRRELRRRYDEARRAAPHGGREVFNAQQQMSFVRYGTFHPLICDCNSTVAEWLTALGCRVGGNRLLAEFDVVDP